MATVATTCAGWMLRELDTTQNALPASSRANADQSLCALLRATDIRLDTLLAGCHHEELAGELDQLSATLTECRRLVRVRGVESARLLPLLADLDAYLFSAEDAIHICHRLVHKTWHADAPYVGVRALGGDDLPAAFPLMQEVKDLPALTQAVTACWRRGYLKVILKEQPDLRKLVWLRELLTRLKAGTAR